MKRDFPAQLDPEEKKDATACPARPDSKEIKECPESPDCPETSDRKENKDTREEMDRREIEDPLDRLEVENSRMDPQGLLDCQDAPASPARSETTVILASPVRQALLGFLAAPECPDFLDSKD